MHNPSKKWLIAREQLINITKAENIPQLKQRTLISWEEEGVVTEQKQKGESEGDSSKQLFHQSKWTMWDSSVWFLFYSYLLITAIHFSPVLGYF